MASELTQIQIFDGDKWIADFYFITHARSFMSSWTSHFHEPRVVVTLKGVRKELFKPTFVAFTDREAIAWAYNE